MKNTFGLVIPGLTLLVALGLLWPGGAAGDAPECAQMLDHMICPPPNGSLALDLNGNMVCGPGHCARDSRGEVWCSSRPGGAVAMDLSAEILCVDGCVKASQSYCVKPVPAPKPKLKGW